MRSDRPSVNTRGDNMSDGNSNTNQRIKGEFVKREVLACMSYEVEAILKAQAETGNRDLPSYVDIVNLYEYICPNCGHAVQDSEPQDILEWWLVTEWLAEKLEAQGEPVLEWGNNHYWGRTCSGQAILLDGVITSICRDMEILEGQANEWKL